MKNKINCMIYSLTIAILFFMFLNGCKKDDNTTQQTLDTTVVIVLTQSTVICSSHILNNGGATTFEKGFCWSTSQNPSITNNKIVVKTDSLCFTDTIAGFNPNVTYYIRSYAINSKGIAYGIAQSFTLWMNTPGPVVNDIDGNNYNTVKIGTQTWMVENLRSTRYRNGDMIATTTPSTLDITSENTPKYQWAYYGDENNAATYGRLYTWYTVNDSRNIAPVGWHVASNTEWTKLIVYLGGGFNSGGRFKEIGTTHWSNPNTGATNESGFTALPSGGRKGNGVFFYIGSATYWWTSTECSGCANKSGVDWYLDNNFSSFGIYFGYDNPSLGLSVRCVKD